MPYRGEMESFEMTSRNANLVLASKLPVGATTSTRFDDQEQKTWKPPRLGTSARYARRRSIRAFDASRLESDHSLTALATRVLLLAVVSVPFPIASAIGFADGDRRSINRLR
jgi:hypothetical protein